MWSWRMVFVYESRNEELCFIGSNYPNECVARWQMEQWLKEFLPHLFLFQLITYEVKEMK